jgi:hypothetical protein
MYWVEADSYRNPEDYASWLKMFKQHTEQTDDYRFSKVVGTEVNKGDGGYGKAGILDVFREADKKEEEKEMQSFLQTIVYFWKKLVFKEAWR